MGLSGGKVKQRINEDPRNTRWATDTSAPGFRLLSSMGWNPTAPSLGNATSQSLIAASSPAFSKKVSVIPVAKDDNAGIGARKPGSVNPIGGLRSMGLPSVGGMGFVSASQRSMAEIVGEEQEELKKKSGGEFGRLLERLNAAKLAQQLVDGQDGTVEESSTAKAVVSTPIQVATSVPPTPTDSGASTPTLLKNPRMAARSKHLRSKRLASSSNAAAMAEILGIAPPEHQLPTTSILVPTQAPPLPVNPPTGTYTWPVAPPRAVSSFGSMFAPSSSGVLASTFSPSSTGALASTFAASSTSALASTFAPSSTGVLASTFDATKVEEVVLEVIETEEQKQKREKKARKAEKRKGKMVAQVVEAEVAEEVEGPKKAKREKSENKEKKMLKRAREEDEVEVKEVAVVDDAEAEKAARKERKRAKKNLKKLAKAGAS